MTAFKRTLQLAAAFAVFSVLSGLGPASAQQVEIGLLDCAVSGGGGFIIGSTKDLRCEYTPVSGGPSEPYFGVISKFGLDIGQTTQSLIRWTVLAPSTGLAPGALAGDYAGVSAEATAGVGLGANAMIGGFDRSIALQPFSVQSQEGLNLAIGVASMELRSIN